MPPPKDSLESTDQTRVNLCPRGLVIVSAMLVGIFYLIDRKVPNAARAAYVEEALSGSPQATEDQATKASLSTVIVRTEPNRERSGTSESGRALVYAAIEAYTRRPENTLRVTIPGEELAAKVIEPLTSAGLITAETGKALLSSAMDGGKVLITDYFHQKWQDQFRDRDGKGKANGMPTVVCSPVFNAAPLAGVRTAPPRTPAVKRSAHPKPGHAPVCPAPDRSLIAPMKR